jgi:AcrR family transcriptional regulator
MVCKKAGVSRMAFYRHYDGLEQILHEYYQPKIAEVFDVIQKETDDFAKFNVQLEFFNAFSDELLLSLEQGFETIIERIFIAEIEKFYTPKLDEYRIAFISAGVYALWRKWLTNGKTVPLSEVTKILKTLSTEVLQ